MRQATLLFGGKGSESSRSYSQDAAKDSVLQEEGEVAPPAKRVRRAAAQKSLEQTRKQSQMTFGQNGQLCKLDAKDDPTVVVQDSETDEEPVVVRQIKRRILKDEAPKAASKPKEPISLTVKGTQKGPDEVTHAFFTRRPAAKESVEQSATPVPSRILPAKQRWPLGIEAPWPDSSNMHVQPKVNEDHGTRSQSTNLVSQRRKTRIAHDDRVGVDDQIFPWQSKFYASTSAICIEDLEQLGKASADQHYPEQVGNGTALEERRSSHGPHYSKDRQYESLWVDKCRPVRAEECLGNERRAIELRIWLDRLRVTVQDASDQAKSRIIRGKQKREKKGALDGFVVDDEEDDEAWYDHFRKAAGTKKEETGDIEDIETDQNGHAAVLSNAILLTGPIGSGKTAAVYACAAELGFEVFEIYPGQGRRSGKDISQAVGDLGRNHMVSSGGTGGGSTWKGFSIVKPNAVNSKDEVKKTVKASPRQSLILLEEADLLFEEDKGFWTAVIELIATSKRPVIMTCNHLYSVPMESMFLQGILHFEPPSIPSAVDYLKTIAKDHGKDVDIEAIENLFKQTARKGKEETRLAELSMPSSGILSSGISLASIDKNYEGLSSFDLRQAIMQLQYYCQTKFNTKVSDNAVIITNGHQSNPNMTGEGQKNKSPLMNVLRSTELQSFCDCFLTRPADRERELVEPDEYEHVNKADDVQGDDIITLPKVRVKLETSTLAEVGREEQYFDAILGQGKNDAMQLSHTRRRIQHSALLLDLMEDLQVSAHHQVPSSAIVTDYAPIIDNMIKVDDVEQEAYHAHLLQAVQEVSSNRQSPDEEESDSLKAARSSLLQMGIRPSRHTTRILLERGSDGLLALARKESAPCRWISIDEHLLERIRQSRIFPSI